MAELFDAGTILPEVSESSTEISSASEDTVTTPTETSATENNNETNQSESTETVEAKEQVFDSDKLAQFDFNSLSEQDKIAFYKEWLKDNNTPQFAREKGIPSLKIFEKGISESADLKRQLDEASARVKSFEGQQTLGAEELERYQGLEKQLLDVKSIAAKPENLRQFIKEQNPRIYDQFVIDTVWNTLESENGTPNTENLQKVVDRFTGYNGEGVRVKADDVLKFLEVMQGDNSETILSELYEFRTPEEQTAFERTRAAEVRAAKLEQEAEATRRRTESDYRQSIINRTQEGLREQLQAKIDPMLGQFNLNPTEGEPKDLSAYKMDTRALIVQTAQSVMQSNPYLQEAAKALEFLSEPQGFDNGLVREEMESYLSSPAFQQTINAGYKELMNQIEKVVTSRARQFALLAKGYEAEQKERTGKTRPIANGANQMPMTEQDANLAGLSSTERNALNMQKFSQQLYALQHNQDASNAG